MIPYELAGLATAQLMVRYRNSTSQPFTVKLVSTLPGIFSADSSGTGNAVATNADSTLNNATNPAMPGSYITFYITGEGQTNPAGSDGNVASGQSTIISPVTVTIGGVPAKVAYAGSAPGEVNGFAQINAVVPPDLEYGGDVPLFVQIGNVTSQPGLTIAVAGSPPPISLITSFSPNVTTISTSEGGPYGSCDFWVTDASACLSQSNFGVGPTKVILIYICLTGEVSVYNSCSQQPQATGPLSAAMLDRMSQRIAAWAGTGTRLLVRFTYNFGPIGSGAKDAPLSVILNHLDQVAPILLKNKDLIFALEAGFIGTWGEWHDSTNGNDTATAHKALLDKELGYFSGTFPILVRDPGIMVAYTGTFTPQPALGIHDDYYASSTDDAGTWSPCNTPIGYCLPNVTQTQLMSYGSAVSTNTIFKGEFGQTTYSPLQNCSALDAYSTMFHLQTMNLFPSAAVGTQLQNEGCAQSFYNQVGVRIVLTQATISGSLAPDGQLSVALTMYNSGYGRVVRPRPATLVLIQNGRTVGQVPIPLQSLDLRTLQSFTSETFQFAFSVPTTLQRGPVSMALLIPDPAPSLSSNPAYALPLNSLDENNNPIFDPTTGYNFIGGSGPSLGPSFRLDSAGSVTSNPNEIIDGGYSIKGTYTGTKAFTPYLETVPSVLPLTARHTYRVSFRYKILTAPSNGIEVLFLSPSAAAQGNFLPSVTITGAAGTTGTTTLTNTLGPYTDYRALWTIAGTGAISIDDIQIIDVTSGKVIGTTNTESILTSPMRMVP